MFCSLRGTARLATHLLLLELNFLHDVLLVSGERRQRVAVAVVHRAGELRVVRRMWLWTPRSSATLKERAEERSTKLCLFSTLLVRHHASQSSPSRPHSQSLPHTLGRRIQACAQPPLHTEGAHSAKDRESETQRPCPRGDIKPDQSSCSPELTSVLFYCCSR